MQENTVLLGLEKYNKLNDFYNGIKEGKFVSLDWEYSNVYYQKETDIIEALKNRNLKLVGRIDFLTGTKKETIEDVKRMNLWQFFKWKRNNN